MNCKVEKLPGGNAVEGGEGEWNGKGLRQVKLITAREVEYRKLY